MPASDVTRDWFILDQQLHPFTYVVDGEAYKTFQFAFGEKLILEVAPAKRRSHRSPAGKAYLKQCPHRTLRSPASSSSTPTIYLHGRCRRVQALRNRQVKSLPPRSYLKRKVTRSRVGKAYPETMPASDVNCYRHVHRQYLPPYLHVDGGNHKRL